MACPLRMLTRILIPSLILIPTLLTPAAMAATKPAPAAVRPAYVPKQATGQMQGDQRIVHALDRFTFGPRPGDVAAVRATGLDKWFEQQLHPAAIGNTALDARLKRFPAMQWSTAELLCRVPSNAVVRQAANGKLPIPEDPFLHAVYEDAICRLNEKKQAKAEKTAAGNAAQTSSSPTNGPQARANRMGDRAVTAEQMPEPQAMALAAKMDSLDDDPATDAILALGPNERVARLIAMQPPEFEGFMQSLRPAQRTALVSDLSPAMREAVETLENPERLVAGELPADRLTRDIYSDAQLQEVMTDFWLNHFNIYLRKDAQMPYYLVSYERDTIRPFALGKFEDLLEAVAHSPAMLVYLDNAESMGPDSPAAERAQLVEARNPSKRSAAQQGLNENYGRELMELHTLGVNGGYTQADVIQAARILTGWTLDAPLRGGGYQFNPMRHEPGAEKLMGHKFKQNGEMQGRALLHFLATRPATAQFISRELAIRFVSDNPPQALVDRMAKTYMKSGGDIPAVLRRLYHSPEFWQASDFRAKVKTPLEFVVSAARASNADVQNYEPLINNLRQMGMPLYGCVPPSGWDWTAATWVSTSALVDRMNFALALAANRLRGVSVSWTGNGTESGIEDESGNAELADSNAAPTAEAEEARLQAMILPGGASDSTRSAALAQFAAQRAQAQPERQDEREDQVLAGLLIGSPEFQRR